MSLITNSEVIIEDTPFGVAEESHHHNAPSTEPEEVVLYDSKPSKQLVLEIHSHDGEQSDASDMAFVLDKIPGAPAHAQDNLVVEDSAVEIDEAQSKPTEPKDPWDWSNHADNNFISWVVARKNAIPTHSGYDESGIERAIAFLEKLDGEISKAMRTDFDGKIEADAVEKIRAEIEEGVARLHDRHEEVKSKKGKGKKKKKASGDSSIVKEGQKATRIGGIMVTVPLIISRIARVCINGSISGGHDISDMMSKLVKKYGLDKREQAELMQLMADMGYPVNQDRGFDFDDEFDSTSSDNMDHGAVPKTI